MRVLKPRPPIARFPQPWDRTAKVSDLGNRPGCRYCHGKTLVCHHCSKGSFHLWPKVFLSLFTWLVIGGLLCAIQFFVISLVTFPQSCDIGSVGPRRVVTSTSRRGGLMSHNRGELTLQDRSSALLRRSPSQ